MLRSLFYFIFLSTLTNLFGCAAPQGSPQVVIFQNPETLEFFSCEVGGWQQRKDYEENEKCIEKYKQLGYTVWGSR